MRAIACAAQLHLRQLGPHLPHLPHPTAGKACPLRCARNASVLEGQVSEELVRPALSNDYNDLHSPSELLDLPHWHASSTPLMHHCDFTHPSDTATSPLQPSQAHSQTSTLPNSPLPTTRPPTTDHQTDQPAQPSSSAPPAAVSTSALGALALLSLSYMHQASNSYSLPVMLPAISSDLHLDDIQGAMLTTGFSYLYALVLLPVGMLCDRVPRPKLLAAGVAAWSSLTLLASNAHTFSELLLARVGFAAAQAVQNPISFALIPELFPANKSAALSVYNCAVYLGRALAFGAALASAQSARLGAFSSVAAGSAASSGAAVAVASTASAMGVASAAPLIFVPLDKLDLSLVSIAYTRGDYVAVIPTCSYCTFSNTVEYPPPLSSASAGVEAVGSLDLAAPAGSAVDLVLEASGSSCWREVLHWIALPGFAIALALAVAMPEPREAGRKVLGATAGASEGKEQGGAGGAMGTVGASSGLGMDAGARAGEGLAPGLKVEAGAVTGLSVGGNLEAGKAGASSGVTFGAGHFAAGSVSAEGVQHTGCQGQQQQTLQQTLQHLQQPQHPQQQLQHPPGSLPAPDTPAARPSSLLSLLRSPLFLSATLAAAFNDVASYALVAWQSTFYERVHHLSADQYAPILAAILPIGGIVGGVGGGWVADWASKGVRAGAQDPPELAQGRGSAGDARSPGGESGEPGGGRQSWWQGGGEGLKHVRRQLEQRQDQRQGQGQSQEQGQRQEQGRPGQGHGQGRALSRRAWVTVGASVAAAPVLVISMLASDPYHSYAALLVGFALSEGWRAPAANMARSVAHPDMGSSASALYLSIRNLVGGAGPVSVALISAQLGGDLRHALLLVPAMYMASGLMFWVAERKFCEARGSGG